MQKARVCRLGQPCAPRTFKQLLACRTQHHLSLDAEVIADRAELRRDRLYAYSNENDPAQIPFLTVLRVCAVIGNWDLVDFALEPYGRHLVDVAPSSTRSIVEEVLDTAAATGRLVEAVQVVAMDGRVTDEERRRIRAQIRNSRKELDDLDVALDVPCAGLRAV